MNPLTLWKLTRKAQAVANQIELANSKSLWKSKTMWFNLLTAAAELAQVLSGTRLVPTETLAVASAVINIGLRLVTDTPVHVVTPMGK